VNHIKGHKNELALALIILEDKIEYLRHLDRNGEVAVKGRADREVPRCRYNTLIMWRASGRVMMKMTSFNGLFRCDLSFRGVSACTAEILEFNRSPRDPHRLRPGVSSAPFRKLLKSP
jgi:hypothetical protein